jgi:hypothetical protein
VKVTAQAARRFCSSRGTGWSMRCAMRDALRAYVRFAGADRLDWAPHLATEKRLFLARP